MVVASNRSISGANSLKSLRVFCVAARLTSFKDAAQELFITASAVSHQIRSLEEKLGFALFERHTRAVTLTARGNALMESIAPLMDEIFEEVNAAIAQQPRVSLKVSMPPFFATELFIPHLAEFTDRHPEIDLYLDMSDVRSDKPSNSADLEVILRDSPPKDEYFEELFELGLVAACAPSYAMEIGQELENDYSEATLIIHRQRSDAWRDWFREAEVTPPNSPNVLVLSGMAAVVQSAEQGLGVALVPKVLSESRFASKKLLKLSGLEFLPGDKYYLRVKNNRIRNKYVTALAEWIREVVSGNGS